MTWKVIDDHTPKDKLFYACDEDNDRRYLCAWWGSVAEPGWFKCVGRADGEFIISYDDETGMAERENPKSWWPLPDCLPMDKLPKTVG